MTERPIRVLLVDGGVEDSRWVQDLLLDFSETRYGGGQWMTGIDVFHLQRLEESLLLLSDQTEKGAEAVDPVDAVLLNPSLPDSFGLPSLLKLQAAAPRVPVLILSDIDDPDLALSMIRAGAQEFLVKTELDCMPLARSLRLAIERQRTVNDLRALSWQEPATGLFNRAGFETVVQPAIASCRSLGHLLAMIFVEAEGLDSIARSYGREESEIALIELAESIRGAAPPPGIAAHLGGGRFAIAHPATDAASVLRLAERMRRMILRRKSEANRQPLRVRFGVHLHQSTGEASVDDLIQAASAALCENVVFSQQASAGLRSTPETEEDPQLAAAHRAGRNV